MKRQTHASQQVSGHHNLQVLGDGASGTLNVYQLAAVPPVDAEALRAAQARLAELPLDSLPERAPLSRGSRIKLQQSSEFVGRERDLIELARCLHGGDPASIGQVAAATGMGGIGKTQLASELAHRYGQFFAGGVFWISLADPAAVPAEVAACGAPGALALWPESTGLGLQDQVGLVLGAWQEPLPRLLIFDNCEDPALLEQWRPPAGGARILITSRCAEWPLHLGVHTVAIDVLGRAQSIELLRRHRPDLAADNPDLDAIAAELGDLPLALHLAGSYLARYRQIEIGRPRAYLQVLRRNGRLTHASLREGSSTPTEHVPHVARTFELSYARLAPRDPIDAAARGLLARAACFAPGEPIPRPLLLASAGHVPPERAEDALRRLRGLGLLTEGREGTLLLHRLLAAFVTQIEAARPSSPLARLLAWLGRPSAPAERACAAVECTLLEEAKRINKAGYPGPLLAWQPHLRAVAAGCAARGGELASALLNALGRHLREAADYAGAQAAFEQALRIDEAAFGPADPNVARDINNLGRALRDLGDLPGARAAYERALAIDEAAFGPTHPKVAVRVNNLGLVLRNLGDLPAARAALERAVAIDESAHGPQHPSVARDVNNLGTVLWDLGEHAAARAAFERALAIDEAAFGPEHPQVAPDVNNLGNVLRDLGDLPGARAAYERALAIDEGAYGPEHPNVATDVNNLGLVLQDLGELAAARAAYERALAIDEGVLGPDHSKVAIRLNNLGRVLQELGALEEARAAYRRALAIFQDALGPEHAKTRGVAENLAALDERASGP